jgi:hypothetical protein
VFLDRRKHRRFVVSLPLRISHTNQAEFHTSTEDMCEGGLSFLLQRAIEPGARINCEIQLAADGDRGSGRISLRCRVVRIQEFSEDGCVKIGATIDSYKFRRRNPPLRTAVGVQDPDPPQPHDSTTDKKLTH